MRRLFLFSLPNKKAHTDSETGIVSVDRMPVVKLASTHGEEHCALQWNLAAAQALGIDKDDLTAKFLTKANNATASVDVQWV